MENIKIISDLKQLSEVTDEYLMIYSKYFEYDITEIIGMVLVNKEKCCLNSECFEKYKKEENEYLDFLQCPEVEEGMYECSKCKCKKIFTMSKQTRSGDEATTVFARCSKCKYSWIVN